MAIQKGSMPARTKWIRIGKRTLAASAAAALLALAAAWGGAELWIRTLDIGKMADPLLGPTKLIDRNGNTMSEMSSSKIVPVRLEQIPLSLRQAVIAVEDKRFYEHAGVDSIGIVRAFSRNLKQGKIAEGGSTITQQLAKNVFLSHERTLSRKLLEAGYAVKVERMYDKDQILELYLNQIYFGEGQWGVQQAAKTYFGKDVSALTLSEGALLAALPKAPSHYSPFQHMQAAMDRRNLVLDLMLGEGYISSKQHEDAKAEPIVLAEGGKDGLRGQYASYVNHAIEEAIGRYGFTERQLLAGGLRIYTELDPVVQNAMESAFRNDSLFPASPQDQLLQGGAVILDPYTGGIRGIVGQRGDHVYRGFNRATQLKRQPGSSFKPLIVYAPALERGYGPGTKLYDGPLDIHGYKPTDWDRRYRGEVTLREAVVRSWNIPAVWLLNEIGLKTGKSFAEKLGISFAGTDQHLALALGGMEEGVSPLQMAQAYSVFPNLGVMQPARSIVKITTEDGRVLAQADLAPVQAMSAEAAYTMTGLLTDAVREGTGSKAALNRPTAGKTGTTQLPEGKQFEGIQGGVKDAWFAGYTPELVGAVWVGYDRTDREHYLTPADGNPAMLVFREMMSAALKDAPAAEFRRPARMEREDGKKDEDWKKEDERKEKENEKKEKEREKQEKAREKEREKREKEERKKQEKGKQREEDDD